MLGSWAWMVIIRRLSSETSGWPHEEPFWMKTFFGMEMRTLQLSLHRHSLMYAIHLWTALIKWLMRLHHPVARKWRLGILWMKPRHALQNVFVALYELVLLFCLLKGANKRDTCLDKMLFPNGLTQQAQKMFARISLRDYLNWESM